MKFIFIITIAIPFTLIAIIKCIGWAFSPSKITIKHVFEGTQEKPFRIAGYEDERPVWDGSVQVRPDEWNFHEATKICTAKIDEDITALFYKGDLLTAARWPNSKWSDKSFFDHQYWRPCPNSERGTIVDDALAEANLDFTGAMAILNIGSWETYVRVSNN